MILCLAVLIQYRLATDRWTDEQQTHDEAELSRCKRHAFWCATVESERASPSKLWRSVNLLLGRGKPHASSDISVDEFSQFFHDKVDGVRQNTVGAPEPTFSTVRPGASLESFTPVSVDDVVSAISRLPDKSSAADPLPVSLMKLVTEEMALFLTELFNRSMSAGHFPATFITPALKKPGLDVTNVQSYLPISNLSVVSKLLERIVARQLNN